MDMGGDLGTKKRSSIIRRIDRVVAPSPRRPRGDTGGERRRRRRRRPPLAPVLPRPRPPSRWKGEQGSIPLVDRVIVEFV
jgi:hypothetical protein